MDKGKVKRDKTDRRVRDRRQADKPVEVERRTKQERRTGSDRRQE